MADAVEARKAKSIYSCDADGCRERIMRGQTYVRVVRFGETIVVKRYHSRCWMHQKSGE